VKLQPHEAAKPLHLSSVREIRLFVDPSAVGTPCEVVSRHTGGYGPGGDLGVIQAVSGISAACGPFAESELLMSVLEAQPLRIAPRCNSLNAGEPGIGGGGFGDWNPADSGSETG
jgi:hypothetical protein